MRIREIFAAAVVSIVASSVGQASQAGDATYRIVSHTPGVTPFISQLTITASDTTYLASVDFTIAAKPSSVTRLFSQSYTASYLASRGYLQPGNGEIFLPVYGLYASYTNTVSIVYHFRDGSTKNDSTTIATGAFTDPCSISTPTVLQARTSATDLSYDYMLVRGACGNGTGDSPLILDTDGAVRWESPFATEGILNASSGFFDHAVYITNATKLYRVDLDGTVTELHDYADLGVINFHHEIDPAREGMILAADTNQYAEAFSIEVDGAGNVIKTWDYADIITAAMVAGGDDPDQFVYPTPDDWFHNNSIAYRSSDDSLIVSAREDFVLTLDYDTDAIKWILGDTTKKWHEFPSLAQYTLGLALGTPPPIGQHSVSITRDDDLLLMDNGRNSLFLLPAGINRTFSAPRKYAIDLTNNIARQLFAYPRDESIYSQFCGSIYEDEPQNYLIDYAFITTTGTSVTTAQLVGLDAGGNQIFDYQYPTGGCNTAYNSLPFHAEQLTLNTSAQALNVSTRAEVQGGDKVMVGGFIVTGHEAKNIVLRALGPSLIAEGVSGVLANPLLTLYDSTGAVIAMNDEWKNTARAGEITARGLAPSNDHEAALLLRLLPGTYTVKVSSEDGTNGVALFEAYDLSRNSNSELGNLSTRSFVGTGDNALISGFIIGSRSDATVVIRALGPSLGAAGVAGSLSDPTLTVFNSDGAAIATNDNWASDPQASTLQLVELAPSDDAEAATLLSLTPGSYTAVVQGVGGATGVGLLEIYNLP